MAILCPQINAKCNSYVTNNAMLPRILCIIGFLHFGLLLQKEKLSRIIEPFQLRVFLSQKPPADHNADSIRASEPEK